MDELAGSTDKGVYAQHVVNGVVQYGVFSKPVNVLGTTVYGFAAQ